MTVNDPRDEKLDRLLHARRVEPASGDLAQRIILRARQTAQNPSLSLWQWLREICLEFHLPKPAYVLASALVFGLVIGFSTPNGSAVSGNDSAADASVQSVFSPDEALL
jgi:hypothetical protein